MNGISDSVTALNGRHVPAPVNHWVYNGVLKYIVLSSSLIFALPGLIQAYPSHKPLGSWTRDLVARVEQFSKWAETGQQPIIFWAAGFTFPSGFLTAVLQTSARQNNVGGIPVALCCWMMIEILVDCSPVWPLTSAWEKCTLGLCKVTAGAAAQMAHCTVEEETCYCFWPRCRPCFLDSSQVLGFAEPISSKALHFRGNQALLLSFSHWAIPIFPRAFSTTCSSWSCFYYPITSKYS